MKKVEYKDGQIMTILRDSGASLQVRFKDSLENESFLIFSKVLRFEAVGSNSTTKELVIKEDCVLERDETYSEYIISGSNDEIVLKVVAQKMEVE